MGHLFAYSIISSLMLASMYLIYKWMLAGEKQHAYNRTMLWIIYTLSLALPAGLPALGHLVQASASGNTAAAAIEAGLPVISLAEIPEAPLLPRILLAIYLTGLAAALCYTIIVAVKLRKTIASGSAVAIGEFTLVLTPGNNTAPFSWLRYIVMSRADFESSGEVIVTHETRHLRSRHWIDLMLAQAVAIFQWYNPAAWLMREELKTVHEYQADEEVIQSGTDPRNYQMLLIKKAVGARFPSLANSLNHSKLKMRITMMYQQKSSKARRLRALALIPAGALALLVTNLPAVAGALDSASEARLTLSDSKISDFGQNRQTSGTADLAALTVHKSAQPKTDAPAADPSYFVNGERVDDVNKIKDLKPSDITAITINKQENPNGDVYITMASNGSTKPEEAKPKESAASKSDSGENQVFTTVENMPKFPGGDMAMMNFVAQNIRYPEAAMKDNIQGRVVVKFVIKSTGKVADVEVIRSVSPELDAEAVRVVKSMPDFTPGTVKGKPVNCQYALPVSFKLQGDDPAPAKSK